jgi:mannose-6-phosphate isomerase-like protein (cupin superfamily)
MDVRDVTRHRGEFFRVLQQTDRSQTAVMTISPGEDAGPEETRRADQIIYIVEGDDPVRRASSRPQPGRRCSS